MKKIVRFSTRKLSSIFEENQIRPDPERLRPLQQLPLSYYDDKFVTNFGILFLHFCEFTTFFGKYHVPIVKI